MNKEFENYLKTKNLSPNTIKAYSFALRQFQEEFHTVSHSHLCQYKLWLIEHYKPETVNLRIRAINCYLESIEKDEV